MASDAQILNCTGPEAFRHAVAEFLKKEDGTTPEMGWPWPWETSRTTDYSYAFDGDKCWASGFGSPWFDPLKEQPEEDKGAKPVFPDMTSKQKVTFGKRSGLIVIGG